jgi:hypothetical protein
VGNIVTDLFYSLSPLYYLSKVKVSVYNKWALRGVFLMGLLATVCAVAKCTELPKIRTTTDPTCKYRLHPRSTTSHRSLSNIQMMEHELQYGSAPSSTPVSSPLPYRLSNPCSKTSSATSSASDPNHNYVAPPAIPHKSRARAARVFAI